MDFESIFKHNSQTPAAPCYGPVGRSPPSTSPGSTPDEWQPDGFVFTFKRESLLKFQSRSCVGVLNGWWAINQVRRLLRKVVGTPPTTGEGKCRYIPAPNI